MTTETLQLRGALEGHNNWVTSIAVCASKPDLLVSGSRDRSVIIWNLTPEKEDGPIGQPQRSLLGHSHIVQDVVVTQQGDYVLSSSWDRTARLWSLIDGTSTRFVGHEGDVLSCTLARTNNLIVTGSRDRTVRAWDVVGKLVAECGNPAHGDWVTSVNITGDDEPRLISAGYDKVVKVWSATGFDHIADLVGHKSYVTTTDLSPDSTLCASAGKDGEIIIWNITTYHCFLTLENNDEVFKLAFSPTRFWLAAATSSGIKIYDLDTRELHEELHVEYSRGKEPTPISLAWSADGQVLYAGYTDNIIRVWQVMQVTQ